jgi:hypothetical protein
MQVQPDLAFGFKRLANESSIPELLELLLLLVAFCSFSAAVQLL